MRVNRARYALLIALVMAIMPRLVATPLHEAAEQDNVTEVTTLLKAGADANQRDSRGYTPLHRCLGWEDRYIVRDEQDITWVKLEVVERLLEHGANPNLLGGKHAPLHQAVRMNKAAEPIAELIVARLLAAGANIHARTHGDGLEHTPLLEATYWDHANRKAVIQRLLRAGACPEDRNAFGMMPLHLANQEASIRLLLHAGVDVHARDEYGATPLHVRASKAKVRQLLAAGADIDARNKLSETPLCSTVRVGAIKPKTQAAWQHSLYFLEQSRWIDKMTGRPLQGAALLGCFSAVTALLQTGADPNIPGPQGNTPLHEATRFASPALTWLLLQAGADVNRKNRAGKTPLEHALAYQLPDRRPGALHGPNGPSVVRLLLEAGASISINGDAGQSLVCLAIRMGNSELVRCLFNRGACPQISVPFGQCIHDCTASIAHNYHLLERWAYEVEQQLSSITVGAEPLPNDLVRLIRQYATGAEARDSYQGFQAQVRRRLKALKRW